VLTHKSACALKGLTGIRRALAHSRVLLELPDHLKMENIDIKKNKNLRFLEGPKERGRSSAQKYVVDAFQESDYDDVDFIDFLRSTKSSKRFLTSRFRTWTRFGQDSR
jgi:hypothetical protein